MTATIPAGWGGWWCSRFQKIDLAKAVTESRKMHTFQQVSPSRIKRFTKPWGTHCDVRGPRQVRRSESPQWALRIWSEHHRAPGAGEMLTRQASHSPLRWNDYDVQLRGQFPSPLTDHVNVLSLLENTLYTFFSLKISCPVSLSLEPCVCWTGEGTECLDSSANSVTFRHNFAQVANIWGFLTCTMGIKIVLSESPYENKSSRIIFFLNRQGKKYNKTVCKVEETLCKQQLLAK